MLMAQMWKVNIPTGIFSGESTKPIDNCSWYYNTTPWMQTVPSTSSHQESLTRDVLKTKHHQGKMTKLRTTTSSTILCTNSETLESLMSTLIDTGSMEEPITSIVRHIKDKSLLGKWVASSTTVFTCSSHSLPSLSSVESIKSNWETKMLRWISLVSGRSITPE